ncbi:cytochrome P450 7A1-like isoform X2 [Clavelina lepadiformis]|uniref:cytochrome P450 7A1-like isoform X2 n=1 Tax=Clavelina lepadiformis TaxID=159417 RepID=UPI004042D61C
MALFGTLVLVGLNVVFFVIFFNKRRRMGEPPLVNHWLPFIGAALDFGKDPINYLKGLQSRHGDVFSMKIAGWDYHVFMNPLDVKSLEKNKDLDHREIIGDFASRMVGDPHAILKCPEDEKDEKKGFLSSLIRGESNHTKSPSTERRDSFTPGKVPPREKITNIIESNLRGSAQLNALCESCVKCTVKAISRNLQDTVMEQKHVKTGLYKLCQRFVFDLTFNMLFGSNPDEENETQTIFDEFSVFNNNSALLLDRIPIHLLPATKRSRDRILDLLGKLDWSRRYDVSRMVSEMNKCAPNSDPDGRRARHLLVTLWAAQANTVPALFWTLFYLLRNGDARYAVMSELSELLQKKNRRKLRRRSSDYINFKKKIAAETCDKWPEMEDILEMQRKEIDKLVILDSCFKETMRLVGSSMSIRKAKKDTILKTWNGDKYKIRKGDYTTFYAPLTHFDNDIYSDPEEYIYDRFLESGYPGSSISSDCSNSSITCSKVLRAKCRFYKGEKRISPSRAIMTFGYGLTRCPGRHIATIEIKLLILSMLKYFNVVLGSDDIPEQDLTHLGFGIMPPKNEVIVDISLKAPERKGSVF